MGLHTSSILFLGLPLFSANIPSFVPESEHEYYLDYPPDWFWEAEDRGKDTKGITILVSEDADTLVGFLIKKIQEDDYGQDILPNYRSLFLNLENSFIEIFDQEPQLYFYLDLS